MGGDSLIIVVGDWIVVIGDGLVVVGLVNVEVSS